MTEIQSLLLLKSALESADMHGVESLLADECVYVSTGRGTIARNRVEVMDFLSTMTDSIKADHVPVIGNVIRVDEVYEEDALYRPGKLGLTIAYEVGDAYAYILFIDMDDDGCIERIVSSQENYDSTRVNLRLHGESDTKPYAFTSAPMTVKDWITALSMWLETEHVDIDDFYQYIDEDTKVVFQKGDAESITLENGLDVEDYFDQLMNFYVDESPHIIRDEEEGLILTYGPMSLIVALNEEGALALISIYIDTRDEDESLDDIGYIEEVLEEQQVQH